MNTKPLLIASFASATKGSRRFSRYLAFSLLLVSTNASFAAPAKSSIPTDLIGKWRWTTISGSTYTDTTTGQTTGGGGMSVSFDFTRDGHYKYNFYVKMRTYNVVTESNTTSEGVVVFTKAGFTLQPEKGHYLGWSNGKKTVDRDMTAEERQKNNEYLWKWVDTEGTRKLMMGPTATSLSQFKHEE